MPAASRRRECGLCCLALLGTAVLFGRGVGASEAADLGNAYAPASAAIIALVGDDFFRQYFTPQTVQPYPPEARCSEQPDACTDEVRRGYSAVTYRFRIPEVPWVDETIQCNVDVNGLVSNVYGVPNCAKDRGECSFPYDEAAAEAIAERAGLEPGIEKWRYHFHWHHGLRTYVWVVSNTLSRRKSSGEGRLVTIDANDGRVLETLWWSETGASQGG